MHNAFMERAKYKSYAIYFMVPYRYECRGTCCAEEYPAYTSNKDAHADSFQVLPAKVKGRPSDAALRSFALIMYGDALLQM
jgi:hypothetical protein